MHSAVVLALAASAAAFHLHPGHHAIKRDLEARQTDDSSDAFSYSVDSCVTALASIYTDMPTAPADLQTFAATASFSGCEISLPASISSEVEAYGSTFSSWYSSHSAEIQSALDACPQYGSSYSDIDYTDEDSCTEGGGTWASSHPATIAATQTTETTGTAAAGETRVTATSGATRTAASGTSGAGTTGTGTTRAATTGAGATGTGTARVNGTAAAGSSTSASAGGGSSGAAGRSSVFAGAAVLLAGAMMVAAM